MTIPADRITFKGGMAWLVMEHLEAWLGLKDRPCVTCDGTGLVPFGLPSNGPERCPDCIDEQHTFEIEVQCWRHSVCQRMLTTYRVSIVPNQITRQDDGTWLVQLRVAQ